MTQNHKLILVAVGVLLLWVLITFVTPYMAFSKPNLKQNSQFKETLTRWTTSYITTDEIHGVVFTGNQFVVDPLHSTIKITPASTWFRTHTFLASIVKGSNVQISWTPVSTDEGNTGPVPMTVTAPPPVPVATDLENATVKLPVTKNGGTMTFTGRGTFQLSDK